MTLVAAFMIEGVPVLVGDFLLTDGQLRKPHMFLPTNPQLVDESPKKMGRRIAGLRKKVHRVNEGFVVGFTGRIDDGSKIIGELHAAFPEDAPALHELSEVLSGFNHKTRGVAQVVGWTTQKRPICFSWVSNNDEGATKVPEVFAGSGGSPFKESLTKVAASEISLEIKTALERAQFVGISKAFSVLSEELQIDSAKNLDHYYGFGAEVVYWDGAKFKFIPKVASVFWNARIREDGVFELLPSNAMAVYENRDKFSAIQVSKVGPDDNGGIQAQKTWVIAITPMHDSMPELDPASVGRLRVLSDFYFFVVAVTDERKGQSLVYKLVTDQEGCSLFKCVDKEGKDYFEINIRELYETVHSMLP